MQKGSLARTLVYLGIVLIVIWYFILSITIFNPHTQSNIYMIYFWIPFVLSFVLMISGAILIRKIWKEAVGKVFKVEKVKMDGNALIRYAGLKILIISSDKLDVNDFVRIERVGPRQGRYGPYFIIAKKLDPSDPDYPVDQNNF
ncbi:MAG: hypothetical protein ACP5F1_02895 [Thermoplasmata archaeon]